MYVIIHNVQRLYNTLNVREPSLVNGTRA